MIINDKRALAYIVTVDEIKSLPNYDRVEYARTNGWWCVVRIGDLRDPTNNFSFNNVSREYLLKHGG